MSYFENKPLFMTLKLRFTDIVIVYFYDILIDQSILWLNQATLNTVKSRNQIHFLPKLSNVKILLAPELSFAQIVSLSTHVEEFLGQVHLKNSLFFFFM